MKTELPTQHIANEALPEIEVTPEMIEAGAEALELFSVRHDPWEWVLPAVYRAMRSREKL